MLQLKCLLHLGWLTRTHPLEERHLTPLLRCHPSPCLPILVASTSFIFSDSSPPPLYLAISIWCLRDRFLRNRTSDARQKVTKIRCLLEKNWSRAEDGFCWLFTKERLHHRLASSCAPFLLQPFGRKSSRLTSIRSTTHIYVSFFRNSNYLMCKHNLTFIPLGKHNYSDRRNNFPSLVLFLHYFCYIFFCQRGWLSVLCTFPHSSRPTYI